MLARANLTLVSIVTLVDSNISDWSRTHIFSELWSRHAHGSRYAAVPAMGRMPMRFALTIITALFLVGCGSPQPVAPTAQITPSSAPSGSGTKRIVQDGAGYILPDGTRVAADERGGFRLPNSEYVTVLAGGLLLPNGVQCKADGAGGFVCP